MLVSALSEYLIGGQEVPYCILSPPLLLLWTPHYCACTLILGALTEGSPAHLYGSCLEGHMIQQIPASQALHVSNPGCWGKGWGKGGETVKARLHHRVLPPPNHYVWTVHVAFIWESLLHSIRMLKESDKKIKMVLFEQYSLRHLMYWEFLIFYICSNIY